MDDDNSLRRCDVDTIDRRLHDLDTRLFQYENTNTIEHGKIYSMLRNIEATLSRHASSIEESNMRLYNNLATLVNNMTDEAVKKSVIQYSKAVSNNSNRIAKVEEQIRTHGKEIYGNGGTGLKDDVASVKRGVKDLKWIVGLVGSGAILAILVALVVSAVVG